MKNLKKKTLKAFTLVEVIVVMVILAILAAMLIPSLTGYIDKANAQSVLVEARSYLTAAQARASEIYAKEKLKGDDLETWITGNGKASILELAELTDIENLTISGVECTGSAITGFTFEDGAYGVVFADKKFGEPYAIEE